ncbi:hypothetical protein JTE90_015286 [Oedothorax gibbosus]|uniref:Uncharacterized protein n=1 Tax=Oedothorax gibbosus TaxID=931172 RepID=A0AAV6UD19_9ARAC|nr:hypothetical protein JTE90_015286 [Oedothorax gibbosus]
MLNIQVSVPPEVDMPSISVCNLNNIKPRTMCGSLGGFCSNPRMFKFSDDVCHLFLPICENHKPHKGFTAVVYTRFFRERCLNQTAIDIMRAPLDDFFQCKIVGINDRNCNTENALIGSFYSKNDYPSFCYTLYSHWGNPEAQVEKIKRSEKIVLDVFVDYSYQNRTAPLDLVQMPKYTGISSSAIQLAIHSRYLMASPFAVGKEFIGGKQYTIKLKQDEKHLLPSPYQTNCTDYMKEWMAKGGTAPLNPLMAVEECKMKAYLEEFDCVPQFVDYPHNETLCRNLRHDASQLDDQICFPDAKKNIPLVKAIEDKCNALLNKYNQPCDFMDYRQYMEEHLVYNEKIIYNCSREKLYTRRCQTITIVIDFEEFEISNVTYNPKYESMELFSSIGGYMGVYLGISIIAMYDYAEIVVRKLYLFLKRQRKRRKKLTSSNFSEDGRHQRQDPSNCRTKTVRIVMRRQSEVFRRRRTRTYPQRRF